MYIYMCLDYFVILRDALWLKSIFLSKNCIFNGKGGAGLLFLCCQVSSLSGDCLQQCGSGEKLRTDYLLLNEQHPFCSILIVNSAKLLVKLSLTYNKNVVSFTSFTSSSVQLMSSLLLTTLNWFFQSKQSFPLLQNNRISNYCTETVIGILPIQTYKQSFEEVCFILRILMNLDNIGNIG